MDQWYYAKGGQQNGPITLGELQGLLRSGALDPTGDLVWNPSMTDWLPAVQVPALNGGAADAPVSGEAHGSHPFAYPTADGAVEEIPIASEPIIPTACVKRAFDLTVKHIGPILLITVIFVVLSIIVSFALQALDSAMGWTPIGDAFRKEYATGSGVDYSFKAGGDDQLSFPSSIISSIISVFFMLGATRIGLRIVDGKPFDLGMLFSGGEFLLKGFVAYILYWAMIVIGLVLLIVPGIIVIVRFGMYQNAIVDKNMGIIESLGYSWNLTKGNGLNLFVILLFSICVIIAGCLALIVGLLFAYPMMWLMWIVAYRWLQYGGRAVLDDPATGQPLLSAAPE